jgi:hypothetical protein
MVRNRVKSRPGACPDPDGWNAVLLPLLVDAQQLGMTGLLASDPVQREEGCGGPAESLARSASVRWSNRRGYELLRWPPSAPVSGCRTSRTALRPGYETGALGPKLT